MKPPRLALALCAALGCSAPLTEAEVALSSFEDASPGDRVDGTGEVVASGPGVTDGRRALRLPLRLAKPGDEDSGKIGTLEVDYPFLQKHPDAVDTNGIALDLHLPAGVTDDPGELEFRVAVFYVDKDSGKEVYEYLIAGRHRIADGTGPIQIRFTPAGRAAFVAGAIDRYYAQLQLVLANPDGLRTGEVTIDNVRLLTPDDGPVAAGNAAPPEGDADGGGDPTPPEPE